MNEKKTLSKNPEKDNSKGSFGSNLHNIINCLIIGGRPVIRNYLIKERKMDTELNTELENNSFLADFIKRIL